jgi:hypothetical protein
LSLDELEAKQIGQAVNTDLNQKLNQIGKMLGSKLFSMVKPIGQTSALILPHSMSLPQKLSSLASLDSKETKTENDENAENQKSASNLPIEITDENGTTGKLVESASSLTTTSSNSSSGYIPRVNQKTYANRVDKLNDVNRHVVKSSQTKFIFI